MRYFIALPWGTVLTSANDRWDHKARSAITSNIRATAERIARQQQIPRLEVVRVKAHYFYPDNRRRDPDNWHLSVKSMIDGALVDTKTETKVIPDDDDSHLYFDGIYRGAKRQRWSAYPGSDTGRERES